MRNLQVSKSLTRRLRLIR